MVFLEKIKKGAARLTVRLNLWQSLVLLAVLSFGCMFLQTMAQSGGDSAVWNSLFSEPGLIFLNFLPIFLVMVLFYGLTSRVWSAFLITDLILTVFLYVNYYKILFRAEAFKFTDLILVSEALNITQNYELEFSSILFGVASIGVGVCLLLFLTVKHKKKYFGWKKRCAVLLLDMAFMLSAVFGIYQNADLYNKIPTNAKAYNEVSEITHKGLVYSFLVSATQSHYAKPENYSAAVCEQILSPYEESDTAYKPHIIAIMSESMFDISACENAKFYPGKDPLVNFRKLQKEGVWGEMVVPGFGGGTASTEFEFLTGASTYVVSPSMPTVYNLYINKGIYCMPRMLKDRGYTTQAIHPGNNWFYHRESVYTKMGFDDFISLEDLPKEPSMPRGYTADWETTALIISDFQEHLETKDTPYFNFTVTIEGHGPYEEQKLYREERLVRPKGMSDEIYYMLGNYIECMYSTDQLLGDVMDYINTVDEPTYLVFFGDHLPVFDRQSGAFDFLGYDITSQTDVALTNKYKTPYVMCANNAAKEYMSQQGISLAQGKQELISANFLSSKFMEYMGIDMPRYFQYVNDLSKDISVISQYQFFENDKLTYQLSENGEKRLNEYAILQYQNLQEYAK